MAEFHLITKPGCPYCEKAKALLDKEGFAYTIDVRTTDMEIRAFKDAGYSTFPQVFHKGELVGGHDKLVPYVEELTF